MVLLRSVGGTEAKFAHLKVLQGAEVGKEDAKQDKPVPNLVAVPAVVVLARMVPLRTLRHIDIDSGQVGSPHQDVVRNRSRELKAISIVIINELVDKQMGYGDSEGAAEGSIEQTLILPIRSPVDPLEEADDEAEGGQQNGAAEVDECHLQLAVHAVVEGREHAARDQQVYPRVVEPVCYRVHFWVFGRVLLDMG